MKNLAKIKRLYLWKPSICKTFWTTLVQSGSNSYNFVCLIIFHYIFLCMYDCDTLKTQNFMILS